MTDVVNVLVENLDTNVTKVAGFRVARGQYELACGTPMESTFVMKVEDSASKLQSMLSFPCLIGKFDDDLECELQTDCLPQIAYSVCFCEAKRVGADDQLASVCSLQSKLRHWTSAAVHLLT